jgi:hypothetical protein
MKPAYDESLPGAGLLPDFISIIRFVSFGKLAATNFLIAFAIFLRF